MDYYSRARDFLTGSIADIQIYQDVMAKSRAIPSKPDAKIQVLGAGFSRTATLSMYSAMLELGYKCYHGIEFECALGVADRWIKVLEHDLKPGSTKGIDWTEVTRGYEAGFDAPFADYWLELSQVYPDAKFVYTHRDGHKWMESYRTAVIETMHTNTAYRIATFWLTGHAKVLKIVNLLQAKYKRDYGGLHHSLIDKRLEAIRKEIPSDRLLVFHPSQGWEPLANFLGVPIPSTPFPKVNDGPSMVWALRAVTIVGMGLWAVTLAIAVGAAIWLHTRTFQWSSGAISAFR